MAHFYRFPILAVLLAVSFNPCYGYNLGDLGKDAISPIPSKSARWILIAGGIAAVTLAIFEDQTDPAQADLAKDRPLGNLSGFADLMGQMVPNAAYVVGMLTYGHFAGEPEAKLAAGRMFRATAMSASLTTALKYTVRERRPDGSTRNSFPSGHSTTAFAFAGTIAAEHGPYWGIPAFSIAGLVAAGRINDNRHFIHDVVGGATIGLAYAFGISERDKREIREGKTTSRFFLPFIIRNAFGLTFASQFN